MPFHTSFTLPQVLQDWPWRLNVNPHHARMKPRSDQWFESFRAFDPPNQKAFRDCNYALLASMIYPFADKEQLRTGQELMNLFFLFDEYSGSMNGPETQQMVDIVMDAFHDPHIYHSEHYTILGKIAQHFWSHASHIASQTCQRIFLSTFEDYLTALIKKSADRTDNVVLGVDEYIIHRRQTMGLCPGLSLLLLDVNIPDYALKHPLVVRLTTLACEIMIFLNDMYSYRKELDCGLTGHNLMTLVMDQYGVDLNSAFKWVADRLVAAEREFLLLRSKLPRWDNEEVNINIERYIDGLGYAVRGLEGWSFESPAYFGSEGHSVRKSRVVQLDVKDEWDLEINSRL